MGVITYFLRPCIISQGTTPCCTLGLKKKEKSGQNFELASKSFLIYKRVKKSEKEYKKRFILLQD